MASAARRCRCRRAPSRPLRMNTTCSVIRRQPDLDHTVVPPHNGILKIVSSDLRKVHARSGRQRTGRLGTTADRDTTALGVDCIATVSRRGDRITWPSFGGPRCPGRRRSRTWKVIVISAQLERTVEVGRRAHLDAIPMAWSSWKRSLAAYGRRTWATAGRRKGRQRRRCDTSKHSAHCPFCLDANVKLV